MQYLEQSLSYLVKMTWPNLLCWMCACSWNVLIHSAAGTRWWCAFRPWRQHSLENSTTCESRQQQTPNLMASPVSSRSSERDTAIEPGTCLKLSRSLLSARWEIQMIYFFGCLHSKEPMSTHYIIIITLKTKYQPNKDTAFQRKACALLRLIRHLNDVTDSRTCALRLEQRLRKNILSSAKNGSLDHWSL